MTAATLEITVVRTTVQSIMAKMMVLTLVPTFPIPIIAESILFGRFVLEIEWDIPKEISTNHTVLFANPVNAAFGAGTALKIIIKVRLSMQVITIGKAPVNSNKSVVKRIQILATPALLRPSVPGMNSINKSGINETSKAGNFVFLILTLYLD